jgi:hypothetical protein
LEVCVFFIVTGDYLPLDPSERQRATTGAKELPIPSRVELVPVFRVEGGMDEDDQKFLAVEGLHAWASAILTQVERLELARVSWLGAVSIDERTYAKDTFF